MTTTTTAPVQTDEAAIRELHDGFVAANRTGKTEFLRAHMAPGPDALLWYNLNSSNYIGMDHICELWDFLGGIVAGTGKEALCVPRDEQITMLGDSALVTYLLHFEVDLGALGNINQDARCTEVWNQIDGAWKMIHFHCSNYVPGIMGGK